MLMRNNGLITSRLFSCRHTCRQTASQTQLLVTKRTYAASEKPKHDVAILGGGITGLASAYYLSKTLPKAKITIYELGRLGGWLSSKRVETDDGDVLFEAGPRTLRTQGNGVLGARLVDELDLTDDVIFTYNSSPAATNRYIYYPDHLVRVPMPQLGLMNMFTTLFTEPAFQGLPWKMLAEPFQDRRDESVEDESVGDFLSRRIGHNAVDRVVSAVLHGIYAGDVYQLSAKSLFPVQWADEIEEGSLVAGNLKSANQGMRIATREADFVDSMQKLPQIDKTLLQRLQKTSVYTFSEGLGALVKALVGKLLESSNVRIKEGHAIEEVRSEGDGNITITGHDRKLSHKADRYNRSHSHVISTLSPGHLSEIVPNSQLSTRLGDMPAVTVMTVNLYYNTPNLHPPGFGYLIPLATPLEQNPERALGVVFDTSYSPASDAHEPSEDGFHGQAQDHVSKRGTKLTVMLGGHYWDGWPVFPSEDEGLQMARSILKRHLNIDEAPAAYAINVQKNCIPQYTVGHEKRIQGIHRELLREFNGQLRVAGSWSRGVGVNDCLRSAWDVVQEIQQQGRTGLEATFEDKKWIRVKRVPIASD